MDNNTLSVHESTHVAARIIAVLFGVVALVWSGFALEFLVYFFGFFAIISSIGTIAAGFSSRQQTDGVPGWALIFMGVIGCLIGFMAVLTPLFMTVAVMILIGAWALVSAIGDFILAFSPEITGTNRILVVLSGIISLIFGLMVLFYPLILSALILVQVLGIFAIVYGILGVGFGMGTKGQGVEIPEN